MHGRKGAFSVKVIIAVVVLLTGFIFTSAIIRRKIYREVDRLGLWKIEILNRPISDEIAKVKSLHMVGETEKQFEQWRNEWENIIAVELPDQEESLIEAEHLSDKYRFRKAQKILAQIDNELVSIEERISNMLVEVDEWVRSEEEGKAQVVTLQAKYNEAKQFLFSHYPSFGKAALYIEEYFEQVDKGLAEYEDAYSDGNYPKAEAILNKTGKVLETAIDKLEKIPEFRIQLTSEIPQSIDRLVRDLDEMERTGFILERRTFQSELDAIRTALKEELKKVEANELDNIQANINECNKRIDALYDLLEKEAEAKQAVANKHKQLKTELDELQQTIVDLKEEVEIVLERYRIDDVDLKSQTNLEKRVEQLQDKFQTIESSIATKDHSYTTILEMFSEMNDKLAELQKLSVEFNEMLSNLRKDEIEAKNMIELSIKQLLNSKRLIERYNLPGIPETYYVTIDEAEQKINEVEERLREKPLDIPAINYTLKQTVESVEKCLNYTEELIETALLSERLIQYGNRYRSRDDSLAHALLEAEEAFRGYDYAEALEIAAKAIEQIDPDALKKINVELEEIELAIPVKS